MPHTAHGEYLINIKKKLKNLVNIIKNFVDPIKNINQILIVEPQML